MEPDVVSNQPKINRNTFKIGSGDLQQQVANNTKRIRVISTMLRSNRRRSADGLSPQATNIQQSLEQSNLILADIAVQLEADFQDRENTERRLLLRNRQEKLELRRRNIEQDIEYKKTEKKITKSNNKVKGPLSGIFGAIGKILLLFGGLVLLKTLIQPGNISKIINSETFQNAKAALEQTFEVMTKNMKTILIIAGAIVGLKLAATIVTIVKVGAAFLAILSNPAVIAGLGLLLSFFALSNIGKKVFDAKVDTAEKSVNKLKEEGLDEGNAQILTEKSGIPNLDGKNILEGYGPPTTTNIEGDIGGNSLAPFFFNQDINKQLINQKNDNLKKENNNSKMTKIEIEGETINLTKNNKKEFNENASELSATNVALVNPVDVNNRYMSESPEVLGFNDSIFT